MALAVSQAENGTRDCKRTNSTNDWGVFQIHQNGGYNLSDLTDCTKNIKIAKEMFDKHGWKPWVAYLNGSYKKFLTN